MTLQTRPFLINEFRAGERPSGDDFRDLLESCVNKSTDGVNTDGEGNLQLTHGLQLGASNATVPGGLRVNAGQLQVFTGGNWVAVATGAAGPFQQLNTTAVAHATPQTGPQAGTVGIGPFTPAAPPTFRFEVPLDVNPATGTGQQVRFGNVVCCNGQGASGLNFAQISHQATATNAGYALRQSNNGVTTINTAAGQIMAFTQGGTATRMGISAAGNVIIGGTGDQTGPATGSILHVAGNAFKNVGGLNWDNTSDARCKEDVRDLEEGLEVLRKVRPVRFRYNGRGGTVPGLASVGVLGQEIEAVLPETVRVVDAGMAGEPDLRDLRIFNGSALTFVLINAVKELASKVDGLERALAAATAGQSLTATG